MNHHAQLEGDWKQGLGGRYAYIEANDGMLIIAQTRNHCQELRVAYAMGAVPEVYEMVNMESLERLAKAIVRIKDEARKNLAMFSSLNTKFTEMEKSSWVNSADGDSDDSHLSVDEWFGEYALDIEASDIQQFHVSATLSKPWYVYDAIEKMTRGPFNTIEDAQTVADAIKRPAIEKAADELE